MKFLRHLLVFICLLISSFFVNSTAFAANSAPVLDSSKSPVLSPINEDSGAPSGSVGTLVSSIIDTAIPAGQNDNFSDSDGNTPGIAIISAGGGFSCYFSLDGGSSWSPIGAVTQFAARLLKADSDNRVYCEPGLNVNGTYTAFTFRAWDQTSDSDGGVADTSINGDPTAFSTATDTVSITVIAINDAPSATNLSAAETYTEDTALNLVDIVASDVDSATITATLTLSNISAGSLSTATSGVVTSTYTSGTGVWTASGALADVNTLLAGVVFTPAANFNGNFSLATTVTDGALSVSGSKIVTGIAVNDAPVLDSSKSPALVSIANGSGAPSGAVGTLVSSLVDFTSPSGQVDNVTDADSGALLGIAITAADSSNFTCYYSLNGGATWSVLGIPSGSSSRLLAADADNRIYCRPVGGIGTFSNVLTFRAWDQTSGSDGGSVSTATNGGTTAFSSATDTVSTTVTASGGNATPLAIVDDYSMAEDSDTTALFVLSNDTDADNDTLSITSVTSASHGTTSIYSDAVLYKPTSNYCGSDSFDYTISDGNGGTDTTTVSMAVNCVNDAPVLDATKSPVLSPVEQNAGAPVGAVGALINSLVDMNPPSGGLDNMSDVDADTTAGIAIVAVNSRLTCSYSLDGGVNWTLLGAVSSSNARTLVADADNRIYCRPELGFTGTITSAIAFRAWDQSEGVDGGVVDTSAIGGITPFSTNTGSASIVVTPIDLLTPETLIISSTSPSVDSSSATFEFESNESPATFECAIDTGAGGVFTPCTSPFTSPMFNPGVTYTFLVRATDAANNTDPSPAQITWTVSNINLEHVAPFNGETGVATTAKTAFDFAASVPDALKDGLSIEYSPECSNCLNFLPIWSQVDRHVEYGSAVGGFDPNTEYRVVLSLNNGLTTGTIYEGSFKTKAKAPTVSIGGHITNNVASGREVIKSPVVNQYHFPRTLKFGISGDDVVVLQKFLGITPPPSKHFGPMTKIALIAYQKKHGLDADGIAGPKTFAVIEGQMNK